MATAKPKRSRKAKSIRAAFEERFGADQASAIAAAAEEHGNGVNNQNLGSDPFKWAPLVAIGYECMSNDGYREYHGITAPWDEIKPWIIAHGDLGNHDGDCDYIAMLAGSYNEFCGAKAEKAA